jgi:hypothetical protein
MKDWKEERKTVTNKKEENFPCVDVRTTKYNRPAICIEMLISMVVQVDKQFFAIDET